MSRDITNRDLENAFSNRVSTISESDFVNVWLPAFAEGDSGVGIAWMNKVAGHPRSKVFVVADKTKERLFSVPALMPTMKNTEINNIHLAIDKQTQLAKAGYTGSDQYIINTLKTAHGSITSDHVEQWAAIFERYGYATPVEEETAVQKTEGIGYVEETSF